MRISDWSSDVCSSDLSREPRAWARRLDTLRPFAAYLLREDPATEFPQTQIFGKSHRRATPHIYTEDEILALLAAARRLDPERSEEHTSELQSLMRISYAVFCLKKKKKKKQDHITTMKYYT